VKRVLLAITGTVVGLVALLSFKSHGDPIGASTGLPSAALPSGAGTSSSSRSSQTTSAPPNPTSPSTSGSATKTVVGDAIDTRYGVVQIQLTVAGSKIDQVSFVQLTAYDGRSQQINSYAGPILLQETLAAQNANINTVSGATYTSDGYLQSLQSALNRAGMQ